MTDKTEAMDLAKTMDELCLWHVSGGHEGSIASDETLLDIANLLRTGKLVVVPDDAVERMAIGISDGLATRLGRVREDWLNESTRADAAAALAALKGADHAG